MPDERVLIVEHDDAVRRMLYSRLLECDVFSDAVMDAREALEKLRESRYALMILDVGYDIEGAARVLDLIRTMNAAVRPMVLATAPRGMAPALDIDVVQIIVRRPLNGTDMAEMVRSCVRSPLRAQRRIPREAEPDGQQDGAGA